jgi:hypothetical protein
MKGGKKGRRNANARQVNVTFDESTRNVQRTERRHTSSHRTAVGAPFMVTAEVPPMTVLRPSPPPRVAASELATRGSRPDIGDVLSVGRQMQSSGLGIDENGAFTTLTRPGMRADGSSQSDYHVMRGSQGSAVNTSSRRMHGRYHVDSSILRNLNRCKKKIR